MMILCLEFHWRIAEIIKMFLRLRVAFILALCGVAIVFPCFFALLTLLSFSHGRRRHHYCYACVGYWYYDE